MMTRQHRCDSKSTQITSGWRATLATVLKERNGARHDGAVASYATRYKRSDVLYAGFARLRELGYKLDTVTSLRGTHIAKLMQDGHSRGLSASTLQNTLSIFRTFAEWIGKAGMVRAIEHYLGPGIAVRSSDSDSSATRIARAREDVLLYPLVQHERSATKAASVEESLLPNCTVVRHHAPGRNYFARAASPIRQRPLPRANGS